MLRVVSGQIVVHSESVKARITTLSRNWLSDTGWPNWLTSRNPGAASPPSGVPGSRSWLAAAAPACPPGACAAGAATAPEPAPHAVTASSPAMAAAAHGTRRRIRPPGLLPFTAVILPCAGQAGPARRGLGQACQGEELGPGPAVGTQRAEHRGGHGGRAHRLHAAQRHAHVLRLDDHAHPPGLQMPGEPVGDLLGQPLLNLRAAGEVT